MLSSFLLIILFLGFGSPFISQLSSRRSHPFAFLLPDISQDNLCTDTEESTIGSRETGVCSEEGECVQKSETELDYFDFVATRQKDKPSENQEKETVKEQERPAALASPEHSRKIAEERKESVQEEKSQSPAPKTIESAHLTPDNLSEVSFWDRCDIPYLLSSLFPDPFQAYVFFALLCWLVIALLLLAREWKKSSRIVLEVYLHQSPESNPLIEDRLKEQLNLPREYSLIG